MGIDCMSYGIDEYKLIIWDTEQMFSYYNMKKSLETKRSENPTYELFQRFYNDYKVRHERYEDDFDYKNWYFRARNKDVISIMVDLDEYIMSYFDKFSINFKPAVNKPFVHSSAYR